ncbi:MAG: methionine--tRNA ligase [Patescibacteria group bacterium]|nr:methionine--tRNA ligase [Patescibacteria group bacterium]MDD5121642.1 methionine--tRNA ligase [Patescibacteria group bacterium]MDD5221904.1 methionine--tRNA ligase [Patescibacteria group bacterium]MDD5396194.1 methionine--tRNA ligase [Patescibacteria group bacterium]
MNKKFYITTPIYYANADPHIGGAYTTVAADVLARYHRSKGEEVFFLTGTDEHGAKIAEAAAKEKKSPKEFSDQIAAKYQLLWDELQISHDNFIRTTDPHHEKVVASIVQALHDKGFIIKGAYSGLYCVGCEQYYTEKELVDGKCPLHLKEPIQLSEDCYFFKLSAFQEPLLKLIDSGEWVIEPKERRNEVMGFLKSEKLQDLAVSRAKAKMNWGITLPWDESQVLYVWVDALLNYLTGLKWDGSFKRISRFWPPDVQLMGKDILRFHAVIWPAVLLALEIALPKKLFIHGYFTINGQKMSKSLGNVIDPYQLTKTFGFDAARYLLLSLFPFGADGDISMEKFYDKYNSNLSSGLGNLVSRVITLTKKYQGQYQFTENKQFSEKIEQVWQKYDEALNNLAFEAAINQIHDFASFCDKYVESQKPWELAKTDIDKFKKTMYNLIEGLRQLSWLVKPFMPEISQKITEALNLKFENQEDLEAVKDWGQVRVYRVGNIKPLFPRLEKVS